MDADVLKLKVIEDFKRFVAYMNKGYRKNYDIIINNIHFIENFDNFENKNNIKEYLMNLEYE